MKKIVMMLVLSALSESSATSFVYPSEWFDHSSASPKIGGILRDSQEQDYKTFNPFKIKEMSAITYQLGAGARLFKFNPVTGKYMPCMASEMPKMSSDGKKFTVKIRKGMKFSDGKSITADDWVTTYKIHADKKVSSTWFSTLVTNNGIIKVTKMDEYTLQFDFPSPSANAYERMSLIPWPDHVFGSAYVNKGAAGVLDLWDINTAPKDIISPGAWKLKDYKPGEKALFAKNEFFGLWNKDSKGRSLPYLDFISRRILGGNNSVSTFLSGTLDIHSPRHTEDLMAIRKAITEKKLNAHLMANVSPETRVYFLTFNWNKKKFPYKENLFRNPLFRKAMSHLSNRDAMVKLALGGSATPIYSSVSPVFKDYQFKSVSKYEYNPEKAYKILADLGYSKKDSQGFLVNDKGQKIEFSLAVDAAKSVDDTMSQILYKEFKNAGIKVNVHKLSFSKIVGLLSSMGENRNWDAVMMSYAGVKRAFPYLPQYVMCGSVVHAFNRLEEGKCLTEQEAKVESLFKKGEQTLDYEARRKIGSKISKIDSDQQAMIYLLAPNYHVAYNKRIGGWYKKALINSVNGAGSGEYITNFIE